MKRVVAARLWRIETQDKAFLLVFYDVVVSAFKVGSNGRFSGVDTTNFVWFRDGAWTIPVPVVSRFPVAYVTTLLYGDR